MPLDAVSEVSWTKCRSYSSHLPRPRPLLDNHIVSWHTNSPRRSFISANRYGTRSQLAMSCSGTEFHVASKSNPGKRNDGTAFKDIQFSAFVPSFEGIKNVKYFLHSRNRPRNQVFRNEWSHFNTDLRVFIILDFENFQNSSLFYNKSVFKNFSKFNESSIFLTVKR